MPSKLPAVGKYAKKFGCCQFVMPGRISFWKSSAISLKSSALSGGCAVEQ